MVYFFSMYVSKCLCLHEFEARIIFSVREILFVVNQGNNNSTNSHLQYAKWIAWTDSCTDESRTWKSISLQIQYIIDIHTVEIANKAYYTHVPLKWPTRYWQNRLDCLCKIHLSFLCSHAEYLRSTQVPKMPSSCFKISYAYIIE